MLNDFDILLADLNVNIKCKYNLLYHFCKDYICVGGKTDIYAVSDDVDIAKEKSAVPTAPIEACESLCIYRAIAERLPAFDRIVFHGAAIEYDGKAFLFTAPSGTGKTTHINLWRQYLGDKVSIINGDKPIIKVADSPIVYGTPWAGKEGYQQNISAPLKAICILKQGKTNNIIHLQTGEAINHLMRQVYLPKDQKSLSSTLSLLGKMIENTPVYLLECDISNQAFDASYKTLTKNCSD